MSMSWKVILYAMFILLILTGIAFAAPCPPKKFYCWQVRMFVDETNKSAAIEHVRACGWSETDISRALRCLKK
jgi:hypothetical protein